MTNICCEQLDNFSSKQEYPILYIAKFREYGIKILDGGSSYQIIDYCPWCGTKLPSSMRNIWFDVIFDELGFDDPNSPDLPEYMKTDEWWIRRAEIKE